MEKVNHTLGISNVGGVSFLAYESAEFSLAVPVQSIRRFGARDAEHGGTAWIEEAPINDEQWVSAKDLPGVKFAELRSVLESARTPALSLLHLAKASASACGGKLDVRG